MSMKNHGGMMLTEENNWFVQQSSQIILPAEPSGSKEAKRTKRMITLALWGSHLHTLKEFLTYSKILWHEGDGFPSLSTEGVQLIFIALKNPSPRPGMIPGTLGLISGTLTITPLRLLSDMLKVHHRLHISLTVAHSRSFSKITSPHLSELWIILNKI
jgi:hypothetical protein